MRPDSSPESTLDTPIASEHLTDFGDGEDWEGELGNPPTLVDCVKYSRSRNPSAMHQHPMLWDHGGGPRGGICYDKSTSPSDLLYVDEIQTALREVSAEDHLDILPLNGCNMASVEIINKVYRFADVVPAPHFWAGSGLPFQLDLFSRYRSGITPAEFARVAVVQYGATVDTNQQRFDFAQTLGASVSINPSQSDTVAAIREFTNGEGVGAVFDCTDSDRAVGLAPELAAAGGVVVRVGRPGNPRPEFPIEIVLERDLDVRGVNRSCNTFSAAIRLQPRAASISNR